MWYQSQHPNRILGRVHSASSECPTLSSFSSSSKLLVLRKSDLQTILILPYPLASHGVSSAWGMDQRSGEEESLRCSFLLPPWCDGTFLAIAACAYDISSHQTALLHMLALPVSSSCPFSIRGGKFRWGYSLQCLMRLCWFPYPCSTPVMSLFIKCSLLEPSEFDSAACQDPDGFTV